MITIPDTVLSKIEAHRPHLAGIIGNLKAADTPALVQKANIGSNEPKTLTSSYPSQIPEKQQNQPLTGPMG